VDINPVFELQDVSFAYNGSQAALDRINLSVSQGESLAILGANGSGKSTVLKLMGGLYYPTGGAIKAFGQNLTEKALQDEAFNFSFRRRVGLLFQDADVQLFSPSVQEEVAFAPLQLGMTQEEAMRRVETALKDLRIGHLRDRAPHRLSGGEKRRVALASILSLNPEVWLMDEPTSELDPRSQSWLVDFILAQHLGGSTIVTATHDLSLVEAVADRVCILNEEHRIAGIGTPAEILSNHDLMVACNLIHEHVHPHAGEESHRHPHTHYPIHRHDHKQE
jgi:cobalt/nickel transport system ATP-binding protein